jgi:transposase
LAQITLRWPALLHPVRPSSLETQRGRALLRLRETLVEARTKLINAVRGVAKSFGERLPAATGEAFARQAAGNIPAQLREAAGPALLALEALTAQIQVYDRRVAKLGERYRATRRLRSIPGVGPLTSLAFVLALDDDPQRLSSSRAAGAFVGLRPKRRDSGESSPELSVTRNGDRLLRRLLVECAQYILGPFGQDSALRRWGLGLAARSGTRRGKRRAVVATARKLAVLLHALWRRDEDFDPLRGLPAPS